MDTSESVVRQLMTTVRCSMCGRHYGRQDVQVLGHSEDLWFVRVTCGKCRTRGLVAAMVRESAAGGTARGEPRPSTPPPDLGPISEEEVESMRQFLRDFDGDFAGVFSRGRPGRP